MTDELHLAAEADVPTEKKKGFWKKLKRGLLMSHTEIIERVDAAVQGKAVLDEDTIEYLEEGLIAADIGVETALELVEAVRDTGGMFGGDSLKLRERLVDEMATLLMDAPRPHWPVGTPRVTLVVGVNGVGKTTSIAKLARRSQEDGESVLLVAGDTFRAAAIEQLALWGTRLGVEVVRQGPGSDPAAIVFDALNAARARNVAHVIVDTAGRLHTKDHLMAELEKIKRVVVRETPDREILTLLVLDATTGQNAVVQAREFMKTVNVDAVLLSKVDGTAKGGVVVAISRELRLPVLFLGVGEAAEDLVVFRPREFATALLG